MNALRSLASGIRHRPLFALSLLVVIVLGSAELRNAAAGSSLSPDERRIVASVHGTATARAAATARVFANQPLTDEQGVGDGETPAAAYPTGPWTIGWSYNCGSNARHPHFKLTRYDAQDFSYIHGKQLVSASAKAGRGLVHQVPTGHQSGSFLLDPVTNCAWHVRAQVDENRIIGRPSPPALPKPDHV